jgi:hypothetical protein
MSTRAQFAYLNRRYSKESLVTLSDADQLLLQRLKDWSDSVDDPSEARVDRDALGLGGTWDIAGPDWDES